MKTKYLISKINRFKINRCNVYKTFSKERKHYLFRIIFLRFLLIILAANILFSCQCPPSLDTNKEFIPDDFSKLCIINLNTNHTNFVALTNKVNLGKNFQFNQISFDENYLKFPSGYANLEIKQDSSILYNSILSTKKDNFYTFVFYGDSLNLQNKFLIDDFNVSQNNALLRIGHLSDYPRVKIKVLSNLPQPLEIVLGKNEISSIIPMVSGNIEIQAINNETNELVAELKGIVLEQNKIMNVFLITNAGNPQLTAISAKL